jgi:hypothetical protein
MGHSMLLEAEKRVLQAFSNGDPVVLEGEENERTVRGDVLARILTGQLAANDEAAPRAALRLTGPVVTGVLNLGGATIPAGVSMRTCTFVEAPMIEDATLRSLRMPGCIVPALEATNLSVLGNLELNDRFQCSGTMKLVGARVEGDLRLSGAVLGPEARPDLDAETRALLASRLRVSGALLARGLVAVGQLRLISARIGGLCSLVGATLVNPGGIALQAERMEVGESVLLQGGFRAEGRVFFLNAVIGGGFDGVESSFSGGSGTKPAVQLLRAKVGRNVSFLRANVHGSVGVRSAAVGGEVVLRDTTFDESTCKQVRDEGDEGSCHIDARHLTAVAIDLRCRVPAANVDLRHARFELIRDAPASWPRKLLLEGCTYDAFDADAPVSVEERLRWIRLDPRYRPHPYDQLVAVHRASGDEQAARDVALAKLRHGRSTLSRAGKFFGYVQDVTVGYGYRTWLAAAWVCAFATAGVTVFDSVPPAAKRDAPAFEPVVYAVDLLLPIVDLGQGGAFVPGGWTRWMAWGLVLVGWVLTTAVVAGLTRHLSRP